MKKEHIMTDAKFVYSINELAYQEVLDDFINATTIVILTYNISSKQSVLLEKLKETNKDCKISIITNIPKRWDIYYKENYRELAHKTINTYMAKLEPNQFGESLSVFFDFKNHGKIIMTNNIVFVGSANFSEESMNNREFGFISKDKELIDFLTCELIPEIKNKSIPYYEHDFTKLLLEAKIMLLALHTLKTDLHQTIYSYDNHRNIEIFYFDENKNDFTNNLRLSIMKLSEETIVVTRNICEAIDELTESNEIATSECDDYTKQLLAIQSVVNELCWDDSIIDLAYFNLENKTNEILQDEYSMEAYEENLEFCIERASETAYNELHSLNNDAKPFFDDLLDNLKSLIEIFSNFIEYFDSVGVRKVNELIDNTNL